MPPDDPGSVTRWLLIVKGGDDRAEVDAAVGALWERYFDRLVQLARQRLRTSPYGGPKRDVALSAIKSFCIRARTVSSPPRRPGRLVADPRDDRRREGRQAVPAPVPFRPGRRLLDRVVGKEPSPELAATVAEELRQLLAELPNDSYRTMRRRSWRVYQQEIARCLGCCTKNVEYKLRNIRATWRPLLSLDETAGPQP
ncbi:MAG: ECF-type sigma factor [Singulisphaera sp.]